MKKSVIASAGAALGLSLEEKALLAQRTAAQKSAAPVSAGSNKEMPMGKIGNLKVSRLICGGNLINGYAHSRDLLYVSDLLRNYFTNEKILDTFQLSEENGINTVIANVATGRGDENTIGILKKYRQQRGGKIQWIAQADSTQDNLTGFLKRAIDNGAAAVFIQGACADNYAKTGRIDLIEKAISFIKSNGVPAGIGGHSLNVPMTVEAAGIEVDFYMKTLHNTNYWSAKRDDQHHDVSDNPADNYWSVTPEETIKFMKNVEKPWIGYKVLAAGAIRPGTGFRYAFNGGADFVVAGMFDFQIKEDADIVRKIFSEKMNRQRPWRG